MPVSKHHAAAPYIVEGLKTAAGALPIPPPSAADVGMKYLQIAALGLPLMAAGGHLAGAVYEKMTAARNKATAFKSMLEQNPHLQDRDQTMVQRYFNTLHHVNPHLAKEPTIAASYVNNMLTTSDPSRGVQMAHRDIFQTALSAGGRGGAPAGAGMADTLQSMGKTVGDIHSVLDTSRQQKILNQARALQQGQEDRLRQRHLQFAKSRARSAARRAGEAEDILRSYQHPFDPNTGRPLP